MVLFTFIVIMTFLHISEIINVFQRLFSIKIFIEEQKPDQKTALEGEKYEL